MTGEYASEDVPVVYQVPGTTLLAVARSRIADGSIKS
jgi:hypothetical protein